MTLGVRKSVRARGGAKGSVFRSSSSEESEERPEVVLGERVSEICAVVLAKCLLAR